MRLNKNNGSSQKPTRKLTNENEYNKFFVEFLKTFLYLSNKNKPII